MSWGNMMGMLSMVESYLLFLSGRRVATKEGGKTEFSGRSVLNESTYMSKIRKMIHCVHLFPGIYIL